MAKISFLLMSLEIITDKAKKIKEITFFAHSLGGIIPIILAKNFLKRSIFIKTFINYEGNLTKYDIETLTKKTIDVL